MNLQPITNFCEASPRDAELPTPQARIDGSKQIGAAVEKVWKSQNQGRSSVAGFTLIELIGVLSIMAICAAVLVPNLSQKVSRTNGEREDKILETLGEAYLRYASANQVIPGINTWTTNLATITGLSANEVRRVNPNNSATDRVLLIHPGFTPSTLSGSSFADPIWSQSTSGATSVTNARIIILSVHKTGLTLPVSSGAAASAAEFDNIWNWTYNPATDAPPSGWSSSWTGNGEYLHVRKINLASLFYRVTISNTDYPNSSPYYQVGSSSTTMFEAATTDAFFLTGSYLRFYEDNGGSATAGAQNLTHTVQGGVNFVFNGTEWSIP